MIQIFQVYLHMTSYDPMTLRLAQKNITVLGPTKPMTQETKNLSDIKGHKICKWDSDMKPIRSNYFVFSELSR